MEIAPHEDSSKGFGWFIFGAIVGAFLLSFAYEREKHKRNNITVLEDENLDKFIDAMKKVFLKKMEQKEEIKNGE